MMKRSRLTLISLMLCPLWLMAQQFYPVKINEKWGLINADGKLCNPAVYDAISEFKQFGYAVIQQDQKTGLLNAEAIEIVPPKYENLKVLDSTFIAVLDNKEWMVINLAGEILVPKGYARVKILSDKYLIYQKNKYWGIIDEEGKNICLAEYEEITLMAKHYFQIKKGEHYGLINGEGKLILPPIAEEIKIHQNQLIFYKKEHLWGAYDLSGKEVIGLNFSNFKPINKAFISLISNQKKQLYSIAANQIISEGGDTYYPFLDYIMIKKDRQLGLINAKGKPVLANIYDEIQALDNHHFRLRYQGKWGIVSDENKVVIPFQYEYIAPQKEQIVIFRKGQYFGAFNLNWEEIIAPEYSQIEILAKGEIKAYRGEKFSLFHIDDQGNLVDSSHFKNHLIIRIGKKSSILNRVPLIMNGENALLLENFEWFYSNKEDKWGLRKLSDGSIQIEPTFHSIRVEQALGFTIVGIEKPTKYDFDRTSYRFEELYGLVNNEVGLLVTQVNMWGIRMNDFYSNLPVARCTFSNGRHGVITKKGVMLQKDFGYIGDFHGGLARISIKGKTSGSTRTDSHSLGNLSQYLDDLLSPNTMLDYTLHDREFNEKATLICQDAEWGYMDTLGEIVISTQYSFAEDFVNQVGIIMSEGKWGVVDTSGKEVIPCEFSRIHFLENTNNRILKIYHQSHKYGLIDTLGKLAVHLEYDDIGAFREGRLAVKRNRFWGFTNHHGQEIISCRFQKVNDFSDGLAAAQLKYKWVFINKQGKVILNDQYRRVGNFKNGLAWVFTHEGVGYINTEGKFIIPPSFNKAFDFENGVARVVRNGKYGLIDTLGNYIIKPKYSNITAFNEHQLAVGRYGKSKVHYCLLDKKGDVITRQPFKQIAPFKEGFAAVKSKDGYGFINTKGELCILPVFSQVNNFSEGRAVVKRNGLCGYIDTTGNEIIRLEYSKCLDFEDGKAVVYKGLRNGGLIDRDGKQIITPSVNRLVEFSEGKGLVKDASYRFYYITENTELSDGYFQQAGKFNYGVAVVQLNGKWGIINQRGIPLVQPKYDKIEDFENGYAKVSIKQFSGITNLKGETIISPDFENISYAGNGVFRVERGSNIGYLDSHGSWIWELKN